jgi:hypothetical protein
MNHTAVTSQIRASLAMLRSTIELCPDALWDRGEDYNPFWVLAYHTVFFAHLYLSPAEAAFVPFARQVSGRSGFGRSEIDDDWRTLTADDVYSKDDVLTYCERVAGLVPDLVRSTLFDAESGFRWLKFSRGEAHLYNLRHIQHHAGQLADRLRREADIGTRWVSSA